MLWKVFIFAFVTTVAYADIQTRRIPRELTMAGLACGLLFHAVAGGFTASLIATGVAFAVGLALFAMGAIGGGDVKLIAALGAMLGLEPWGRAMEMAIAVAALMAVIQMVRHGAVRQTFRNIGEIFKTFFRTGFHAHPVLNVRNSAALRSPFGVAAAVGTLWALIR